MCSEVSVMTFSVILMMVVVAVGTSDAAVVLDKMKYMNEVDESPVFLGSLPPGAPVKVDVAPKPCCTPSQWEGYISGFVGYKEHWYSRPKMMQEMLSISYDGTNKRIAMNGTVYNDGKLSHFRVIELFQKKKMYVIDENGKCTSQDLPMAFQPACVPGNATYGGRYRMGLGEESLQADVWAMEIMGYHVVTSVTPEQCIPLSEEVWGKGEGRIKVPALVVMGYVNLSAGIKSPSIFTPPKDCPQGVTQLGEGLMGFMHGKMNAQ